MKLSENSMVENAKEYESKGYSLPEYDREQIRANTLARPEWIHFGAGNIFRAFQGNLAQRLLNEGKIDTGIVVCEGYDYDKDYYINNQLIPAVERIMYSFGYTKKDLQDMAVGEVQQSLDAFF